MAFGPLGTIVNSWIDDILDGTVAAIDQQAADGTLPFRIYNLGGSHPTSLKELVDRIAAVVNVVPPFRRLR